MNITEKENSFIISRTAGDTFIMGFTKPVLKGDPAREAPKALSFLEKGFGTGYMKQVHGPDILLIDGPGQYTCDGIFTRKEDIALIVKTADCMPLLFSSEREGVAGVVHMGWRSANAGILDNIPFDLSSFTVAMGVGMRKCCYRVGEEFLAYRQLMGSLEKRDGGYYFDPVGFAVAGLIKKGMKASSFFDYNVCSCCSKAGFYSHRRDATDNRTMSFVMIHKREGA